jgi:hypothetical protein
LLLVKHEPFESVNPQIDLLSTGLGYRFLAVQVNLAFLYQFSVKLHIIFTPPNLPLVRGGATGGGVLSMGLHKELVLSVL